MLMQLKCPIRSQCFVDPLVHWQKIHWTGVIMGPAGPVVEARLGGSLALYHGAASATLEDIS